MHLLLEVAKKVGWYGSTEQMESESQKYSRRFTKTKTKPPLKSAFPSYIITFTNASLIIITIIILFLLKVIKKNLSDGWEH